MTSLTSIFLSKMTSSAPKRRSVHHVPLNLVRFRPTTVVSFSDRVCRSAYVATTGIRYHGVRSVTIPSDPFNFHHHHHHDDDHKEKDPTPNKMWKFLNDRKISKFLDRTKFGEIESKSENQIHAHHVDDVNDEADIRSKLYAKHYEMKLRKRFHYNNGEEAEEEKAKEENKWHKREMKKGGFMRSVRKFLHHYFD